MNISVVLDEQQRTVRPGDTITGTVHFTAAGAVHTEVITVSVVSGGHKGRRKVMQGTLAKRMKIDGTLELPLSITLPPFDADMAKANWNVEVTAVEKEGDEHHGTASLRVEATSVQKSAPNIAAGIFMAIVACIGFLGLNMGIVGVPEKIIPEGVRWFAMIMGLLAMFAVAGIGGTRTADGRRPWSALPGALLIGTAGLLCLYMFMLQPDFYPWQLIQGKVTVAEAFSSLGFQPLTAFATADDNNQRLMELLAAGALLPVAAAIAARKKTAASMVADIALTAVLLLPAIVYIVHVAFGGIATANHILAMIGLAGIIAAYYALRSARWSLVSIDAVLATAVVPLVLGIGSIISSSAAENTTAELAMGGLFTAWGLVIAYKGGRNLLVAMTAGNMKVRVSPNEVPIGGSVLIEVEFTPATAVTIEHVAAIIQCDIRTVRNTGTGDREYDTQTVYKDKRELKIGQTIERGVTTRHQLRVPIPVGQRTTDTSSTTGVSWTMDVHVALAGKPDWASSYDINVVHS